MMSWTMTTQDHVKITTTKTVTRTVSSAVTPSQKRRRINAIQAALTVGTKRAEKTHITGPADFAKSVRIDTQFLKNEDTSSRDVGTATMTIKCSHSASDIWKWTLTSDAIAPCFVKDALDMRADEAKGCEFFWLGRIPCRTVCLLGIMVGVQVFERKTIYSLDDGTGVMDCIHLHHQQVASARHASPAKPNSRLDARNMSSKPTKLTSPYELPAQPTASKVPSKAPPHVPSPLPEPIACVGACVRIAGRVVKKGQSRVVLADEIGPCTSPNDEPNHWLSVLELHRTSYFAADLGPFVIPPLRARASTSTTGNPTSMHTSLGKGKGRAEPGETLLDDPEVIHPGNDYGATSMPEPQTPSSVSGLSSPTSETPSSVASSSHSNKQSPPRLRHPSRLHTRDLTSNTFRIYLKHYMDNVPPLRISSRLRSQSPCSSREPSPSPLSRGNQPSNKLMDEADEEQGLKTPRKRSGWAKTRGTWVATCERTPRPVRKSAQAEAERTPRPSRVAEGSSMRPIDLTYSDDNDINDNYEDKREAEEEPLYGFTLSYLRRVPELTLLARRIVDAEARRRAREERQREKTTQDKGKAKALSTCSGSTEPRRTKMKRLFRFAVRQLYEEGSIVLWEGPTRPLPSDSDAEDGNALQSFDKLWKMHSSSANTSAASNITSMSSTGSLGLSLAFDKTDDGYVSDTPPDEEAYIPLTPAYLARIVERAIREYMARSLAPSSRQRLSARAADRRSVPAHGPTPAEILAWLWRDGRWERVGEWAVKDALLWAKEEGRVWCVGQGRWELCE